MATMKIGGVMVGVVVAVSLLSGCEKKEPVGQVIASVNGSEITRRDLETEFEAANLPRGTDMDALKPTLVNELVSRQLIVEQARREGLDKTPDYVAANKRATDVLLAQMMVAKWSKELKQQDQADVDKFIEANPQMFAARRVLMLDQLQTSPQGIEPRALQSLNTMDAVVTYLQSKNHGFQRGQSTLDTVGLNRQADAEIAALPPGMPFVTTRAGVMVISAITGIRADPVPPERQRALAVQALRQQAMSKASAERLTSLKAGANISYQQGFAPVANAK